MKRYDADGYLEDLLSALADGSKDAALAALEDLGKALATHTIECPRVKMGNPHQLPGGTFVNTWRIGRPVNSLGELYKK